MRCGTPRLVFAAPHSGSGKTTVVCAFLQALHRRGTDLCSFKCGPDYIDPMFHRQGLGVPSCNLDLFFAPPQTVRWLFARRAAGRSLAVVEGVMGYYDGVAGEYPASTAHLARELGAPAVLVADARGAGLSLAAEVKGFCDFMPPSGLGAVVLNRCTEQQYRRLAPVLERETGLKAAGFLPPLPDCALESRHLGLVTPAETSALARKLDQLGETALRTLDIDLLLALAGTAPALDCPEPPLPAPAEGHPRIAVAKDKAFCFYYADNVELLERLGAELVPFSPLADYGLPQGVSALYLGGGYPELFAETLSANAALRGRIAAAVAAGLPTLAECGGFLYLLDSLEDPAGRPWPMCGALPGQGVKGTRLSRFGYVTLTAAEDNLLCPAGASFPAHEFHYWDASRCGAAFEAVKPVTGRSWHCITATQSLFAGFPHLYFYAQPDLAARFVSAAARFAAQPDL